MTTRVYASTLNEALNKKAYATLVKSLGKQLNDRKDRFDKSDIIEQSLEVYTNGRLKWVDDIGRDHNDIVTGYDLEFKYGHDSIFTKRKKEKKVIKIKLKNSLGVNKGVEVSDPADYYMIGQQDAIALMSWEEIKPYLVSVPDGIEAHIPFEALTFIFRPEDVVVENTVEVDYKKVKAEAQRKLIESIL
jgi:hypothetical protein